MGVTAKLKKKKGISKVSRKKKKVGLVKAQEPQEILNQQKDLLAKLGVDVEWDKTKTLEENYIRNGLAKDLNSKFGRQSFYKKKEAEAHTVAQKKGFGDADYIDDDDLRVLRGEQRKTGKAAPKQLTQTQVQLVEALVAKHKDDVEAMARDIKINQYQHSVGQLRKLLDSYSYWGAETSRNIAPFRAPKKSKGGRLGRA